MTLPRKFEPIDFAGFHREELPRWLAAGRGPLAGAAAAHLRPLTLQTSDGAGFTYVPEAGGIRVVPAATGGASSGGAVLELSLESWQGLVNEIEAPAGLIYAGRVKAVSGSVAELMAWETPLRAMLHGRAPYRPEVVRLLDRQGGPLDVEKVFSVDRDRCEMAHFLRTAGYLFVRGVFAADEVARLREAAAVLNAEARPGDRLSWWGKGIAGADVLCRVTRGATQPALAALRHDPRLLALGDLAGHSLVPVRGEGDGVTVIWKNPGMTEGLGDLPWHRDCGMGGHALNCPTAVVSVFLTEGSPETGELTFLPGSTDLAFNGHDPACAGKLPAAHFVAQPGDVTFHLGDTVHAAPPPQDPARDEYRISAILSFGRPDGRHHRGEASYNAALHRRDDGQIEHLDSVARRD